MGGTYRPVYEDEAIALQWDQTSQWALTLGSASTSVSATTFQSIAGAAAWTIQLPGSLIGSASGLVGLLDVQVNNSNTVVRASASTIPWTVNPLLNQPSMGKRNVIAINTAFTGNWVTVGTVGMGVSLTAFTIPARYVRVSGAGVSALVNSNAVLVWSTGMSSGN